MKTFIDITMEPTAPHNTPASPQDLKDWLNERMPPDETRFSEISEAYLSSSDERQFVSTLVEVGGTRMAETLVLFKGLMEPSETRAQFIRQAHQHYIINTDGQIPEWEGEDSFDVFEWAKEYAAAFNIKLEEETNDDGKSVTWMTIDDKNDRIICEEWGRVSGWSSAWSLRQVGHLINQCRYGRFDVISSRLFPFEGVAGRYSKLNAMWMSDLSSLAYRQGWYVEEQLENWGFESVRWLDNQSSDTQAFVARRDNFLVVCFRGTSSAKDMLTDLKVRKRSFGDAGRVHRGFLDASDSSWQAVLDAVNEAGPDLPVFVTGHSLGAALALLAAYRLADAGKSVEGVYVYGCPRVGNDDYADAYNQKLGTRTFPHVNHKDIVTTVPPRWLGYHHVGQPARRFDTLHAISIDEASETQQASAMPEGQERDALGRQLMDEAAATIESGNEYLGIRDLTQEVTGLTYTAEFETGAIDEHGIAHYLFKFACSIIEDKFSNMA